MIYSSYEGSDHCRTTMQEFVRLLRKHKQSRKFILKTVSSAPLLGLQYKLNANVCRENV